MAEWAVMLNDRVIKRFLIQDGMELSIGRGNDADVIIDNTAISRLHSSLKMTSGIYMISDLGSLNGTTVNGKAIKSAVPITEADKIGVGKFKLLPADQAPESEGAISTAISSMDMEDETVFVTPKMREAVPKPQAMSEGRFKLIVEVNGQKTDTVVLDKKNSLTIGKSDEADITIGGWFVAKIQCYVLKRKEKFVLAPQKNWWAATKLNGQQIKDRHILRNGDCIEVRNTKIKFDAS
jgi:pSer/pThr/pTyr-binding forkhead associated (FHA) protein